MSAETEAGIPQRRRAISKEIVAKWRGIGALQKNGLKMVKAGDTSARKV